jgi:hypothetical protein
MIGMMLFAAQAPMQLAANDEQQWRLFVRASLQRPLAPADRRRDGSRLQQLQGVVRGLGDDRGWRIEPLRQGPQGL